MKLVLGNDGKVSKVLVTREEWRRKHRDYKSGRLGRDARGLVLDTDGATALVPYELDPGGAA